MADLTISFGGPEAVGERVERFVEMPAIFLVAPRHELLVQERTVLDVRYRRFEKWYEGDRLMGRWSWITLEDMIAEKERL